MLLNNGKTSVFFLLEGKCNSEVNISHETTTMVVWIYDGI